jgi:hypothetical protein
MVEMVMAMALVTLGVVAMLQLLPGSWRNTEIADNRGRAAEILQKEMESTQMLIMNPCNIVTIGALGQKNTTVSGQAGQGPADFTYRITKSIAADGTGWLLTIGVARGDTSIGATRKVIRQDAYKYPTPPAATCSTGTQAVNFLAAGGY